MIDILQLSDTIKKKYGTETPGDCTNCKKYLACRTQMKCEVLDEINWLKELGQTGDAATWLNNIYSKFDLCGLESTIYFPWLIFDDKNKEFGWVNIREKVISKMYSKIEVVDDILICSNKVVARKSGEVLEDIDIYTYHCGKLNLASGISNLKYCKNEQYRYTTTNKTNYIVCRCKDSVTGFKGSVIINSFGKRVIVAYDSKMVIEIQPNTENIIIIFRKYDCVIKLDKDFKVLSNSKNQPILMI